MLAAIRISSANEIKPRVGEGLDAVKRFAFEGDGDYVSWRAS